MGWITARSIETFRTLPHSIKARKGSRSLHERLFPLAGTYGNILQVG